MYYPKLKHSTVNFSAPVYKFVKGKVLLIHKSRIGGKQIRRRYQQANIAKFRYKQAKYAQNIVTRIEV